MREEADTLPYGHRLNRPRVGNAGLSARGGILILHQISSDLLIKVVLDNVP